MRRGLGQLGSVVRRWRGCGAALGGGAAFRGFAAFTAFAAFASVVAFTAVGARVAFTADGALVAFAAPAALEAGARAGFVLLFIPSLLPNGAGRAMIVAMLIVAIAWIYVVGMAALAEAMSPQGTLLGAFFTLVLYGVLPLSIVLYILGTPGRKRALRRAEEAEKAEKADKTEEAERQRAAASPTAAVGASTDPDRRGHAARGPVGPGAAEREEA